MNIEQAKEKLRIPDLLRKLGIPSQCIPTSSGSSARCPWPSRHRNGDRNPSFSVYADGKLAKCFACDLHFDAPGFLEKWSSCSRSEACRRFIRLAERETFHCTRPPDLIRHALRPHVLQPIELPHFITPTRALFDQVASIRKVDVQAVELASQLGVLKFASVCGQASWLLVDPTHYVAEARRLDGKMFPVIGALGERKAHTVKGSAKAWPLGIELVRQYPTVKKVMLVEGGPDYLAALHFLMLFRRWDVLPVAILGRSIGATGIHSSALGHFGGRRVRIYPHRDPDGGGTRSALNWAKHLSTICSSIDLFDFSWLNCSACKDLNDLTSIYPLPGNLHHMLP